LTAQSRAFLLRLTEWYQFISPKSFIFFENHSRNTAIKFENGVMAFRAHRYIRKKPTTMIATIVHVYVKPEFIQDFINATRFNHENSIKEPGNLRFDILQDIQDPNKFIFYEAYTSEQAAAAHKETSHYLQWRDTVASWMAKPREGVKHLILFPKSK
jgi:(4S)-4-hydroxy-5-phosphonooxypentane-2,3-dione isomerase